jgi:hypothetical protein
MTWKPQPGPQKLFVESDVFEVVYGGARGGGKTDAALGDFARHARYCEGSAQGLLVRRTRTALEPTIARARQTYEPEGGVWSESRSCFAWPTGAVLYFRHLDHDSDADLYQGHAYTRVYVEEMTQFPAPGPIDKLKATIRSSAGAPCGFRATCNPGGAGHNWVKARYVDAAPPKTVITETFTNPFDQTKIEMTRMFIPARLHDNPELIAKDPDYVARLQQCGSAELVRAWLEGDWNVIQGAFFDKWSARNIVKPFPIPGFWTKFRSFDWGFAAPFSAGWWAIVSDSFSTSSGLLPRGAMVRYREWYGRGERDNEGVRLTAEQIADGILAREAPDEKVAYGVADPSVYSENGGPSHGERMGLRGLYWRPADNTRVGKAGALSGWDQMRARIEGTAEGGPMLYVFDTCRDFIRTVPVLQHDAARLEDLDTSAEDHIADETRYACLSRPMIAPLPEPAPRRRPEWDWEAMRSQGRETVNMWKAM